MVGKTLLELVGPQFKVKRGASISETKHSAHFSLSLSFLHLHIPSTARVPCPHQGPVQLGALLR